MAASKTGGGIGTNQHQVRGTSARSAGFAHRAALPLIALRRQAEAETAVEAPEESE